MKITLKGHGLVLEANKVDTPTGAGWSIIIPDGRKVLIKFHHGKWETAEDVSNGFVQATGNEISRLLAAGQPEKSGNGNPGLNPRPKRARIIKYVLIQPFCLLAVTSFEIIIWIYNLSLSLVVTPIDPKFRRFKVETNGSGPDAMIVKCLRGHSWIVEKATMKFFTKKYVHQLGKLIEIKKPEWFNTKLPIDKHPNDLFEF